MNIKGKEWKLKSKKNIVDEDNNQCLGLCDYETRILYYEPTKDKEVEIEIIVHETLHAALHEIGLDIGRVADEMLVSNLTEILMDNFKIRLRK